MKVYLAGPVIHAKDNGISWRENVRENFENQAEWVDPTEDLIYSPEEHTPEEVVENDRELLKDCDAVLVGLTKHRTVGTWREVEYALTVLDIPVVFWFEPRGSRSVDFEEQNLSPWLLEAGPVFRNFMDCLDYIEMEVNDG
jgi:nucleoside 2-deoxyribosyltransferase